MGNRVIVFLCWVPRLFSIDRYLLFRSLNSTDRRRVLDLERSASLLKVNMLRLWASNIVLEHRIAFLELRAWVKTVHLKWVNSE